MSRPTDRNWVQVRLPAELHARLVGLAAEVQAAHVAGRTVLPGEFADRVPLHHVVARLLDEVEARRERSRRPRNRKPALDAGATAGVYTDPAGTPADPG